MKLPASTNINQIHLRISDLSRSLKFYRDYLGFYEIETSRTTAALSVNGTKPNLLLEEVKGAAIPSQRLTGLYHVAYLVPTRYELARIFNQLMVKKLEFQGFADHGVSEALYLADPDKNGIEIYYDKPEELWEKNNGIINMYTKSLDLNNLISELNNKPKEFININPASKIGHIHLKVSSLEKAERFYCDLLGFEVTQRNYEGALFVSAGGYHHHLGFNTWMSKNNPPQGENSAGLISFNIQFPDAGIFEQIKQRLINFGEQIIDNSNSITIKDFDKNNIILSLK